MAQIKVYGESRHLNSIKSKLSDAIHDCVVEALQLPPDKRFHRFFPLAEDDFYYPSGRTGRYTIIEISMFAGRSVEIKKRLIKSLFERLASEFGIGAEDIEITIFETPKQNWGIRGVPGDELELNYRVEI